MDERTPTRSSLAISEQFEALDVQFSVLNNLDGAFIDLNFLKATMPRAIDVYADIVLHRRSTGRSSSASAKTSLQRLPAQS